MLSLTDKRYSVHSSLYYWKSILLCGAIKGVQLYLWITALSSCGPILCVLFEQSPKLLFVVVGLLANSYPSNRTTDSFLSRLGFLYVMGIVISACGYGFSLFGLPHIPTTHFTIPESVYSSLNSLQLVHSTQPLQGVLFVVIASFPSISS